MKKNDQKKSGIFSKRNVISGLLTISGISGIIAGIAIALRNGNSSAAEEIANVAGNVTETISEIG